MNRLLLLLCCACSSPATEVHVPAPAPVPRSSTWDDAVTGQRWAVATVPVVWSVANEACVSPWRTPRASDFSGAYTRGLIGGVEWGESVSSTQALTFDLATGKLGVLDKDKTAGTACVKENQ